MVVVSIISKHISSKNQRKSTSQYNVKVNTDKVSRVEEKERMYYEKMNEYE